MELKKNPKIDLENKKNIFFLIGLTFSLSVTFMSFEWKFFNEIQGKLGDLVIEQLEDEMIPITRAEPPPPPPPPPQQQVIEEIQIVEDDEEIEDEIQIDTEADENTEVQEIELNIEEEIEEEQIFLVVEEMPEYPGGQGALMAFVRENVVYPEIAIDNNIEGTVYVSFVVDKTGKVNNIKILRGVHPALDKEAIAVVQKLRGFSIGKQRGKPVSVQFNLPIKFNISE